MIMRPRLRRFALVVHVSCSVALLGAVAAFFFLALAGLNDTGGEVVRAAYPAMAITVWLAIIPLTTAALITGLVQSLGTAWGLFRHYWVVAKLVVMLFVSLVLALQLRSISFLARAATDGTLLSGQLEAARLSPVIHSGAGLVVLLIPVALSLYKPRGLTRYGWRKRHGQSVAVRL